MAISNPLTGYEPNQLDNQLDNFDYSETSAAIFQDESVDMNTEPSYTCDAELDDELLGKTLSSPLFIQEREEPANLRQTYHSHKESLLPAQSFFTRTSTERPVYEPKFRFVSKNGNQVSTQKTSESGFSLKDKKEQILVEVRSCVEVGLVIRPHLLFGEVRNVATALKVVEEMQE